MKHLLIPGVVVLLTGCASPHQHSHDRLRAYVAECLQPGQFRRETQPEACTGGAAGTDRALIIRSRREAQVMGYGGTGRR